MFSIDQKQTLLNKISAQRKNSSFSDVVFVVEGERFAAHRAIYACQSQNFENMLFGSFKEGKAEEVELKDIRKREFAAIQRYIYTGELEVANLDQALVLLELANRYELSHLKEGLGSHLQDHIALENVLQFYHCAFLFNSMEFCERCLLFIDTIATEIIMSKDLISLSPDAVLQILSRKTLHCSEEIVFNAVRQLVELDGPHKAKRSEYLKCIRLSVLNDELLHTTVRDSGLFELTEIMDALKLKGQQKKDVGAFNYPIENVAHAKCGAQITSGSNSNSSCISGNIDQAKGYTYHKFDSGSGITIKLPGNYLVRKFKMLLYDDENRKYSYHIDVSTDNREWKQVIYRNEESGWQTLDAGEHYQCSYIRIIGTINLKDLLQDNLEDNLRELFDPNLYVVCFEIVPCRPSG